LMKFGPRYLPNKNISLAFQTVAVILRISRPKSARASPQQCTQSASYFIQIGTLLAELLPNARAPPNRALK